MGDRTSEIKKRLAEFTKTHSVYDGNNRLTDYYETSFDAKDQAPAMRTQLTYTGPATVLVENTKETEAQWNSAWDIP